MKWWFIGFCLATSYLIIPVYVHWLRHRPHRLTEGTQHINFGGLLAQLVLMAAALLTWWLG